MDKLIKELEAWWGRTSQIEDMELGTIRQFGDIMRRAKSSAPVESLAVLANKRHGVISQYRADDGMCWLVIYRIEKFPVDIPPRQYFNGATHHEAESKARAYLESLPDRESK